MFRIRCGKKPIDDRTEYVLHSDPFMKAAVYNDAPLHSERP